MDLWTDLLIIALGMGVPVSVAGWFHRQHYHEDQEYKHQANWKERGSDQDGYRDAD